MFLSPSGPISARAGWLPPAWATGMPYSSPKSRKYGRRLRTAACGSETDDDGGDQCGERT